jgi:outer membrane protein OmpA-like peptidoglycan-associated protein
MNGKYLAIVAILALGASTGCATKKYVRQETAPVINRVNELDELTAKNSRDIRDVDTRAQQGIQSVNTKADAADQKAQAAGQRAGEAQTLASQTAQGVNRIEAVVANLDNYRPVVETSVHFGFDKADLTSKAKKALDLLAAELPNTKRYIIEVVGGTDSTGDAHYNYQLSERRAEAVIQYLATKHSVPAHKIYVVGLGKDQPAESNRTSAGRAKNRRVDVRLLTNMVDGETSAQVNPPSQ